MMIEAGRYWHACLDFSSTNHVRKKPEMVFFRKKRGLLKLVVPHFSLGLCSTGRKRGQVSLPPLRHKNMCPFVPDPMYCNSMP